MKRRRVKVRTDLESSLGSHLESHTQTEDYSDKGDLKPDLITKIPENTALSLGRPEGFHLSDVEKYLLEQVFDSFDQGALNELSPMQRACFTDVIISGDTYDNVAARYHISRSAVQKHIERAAARIRKVIRKLNG